jgi:hypothetical protein
VLQLEPAHAGHLWSTDQFRQAVGLMRESWILFGGLERSWQSGGALRQPAGAGAPVSRAERLRSVLHDRRWVTGQLRQLIKFEAAQRHPEGMKHGVKAVDSPLFL